MKIVRKSFLFILIAFATILLSAGTLAILCLALLHPILDDACRNELISSSSSPDGLYEAYIFNRDCGATTDYSYQLSVLKAGKELGNFSGNAFISEGEFTIDWKENRLLEVQYPKNIQTYEMDHYVGKVFIEYSADSIHRSF